MSAKGAPKALKAKTIEEVKKLITGWEYGRLKGSHVDKVNDLLKKKEGVRFVADLPLYIKKGGCGTIDYDGAKESYRKSSFYHLVGGTATAEKRVIDEDGWKKRGKSWVCTTYDAYEAFAAGETIILCRNNLTVTLDL